MLYNRMGAKYAMKDSHAPQNFLNGFKFFVQQCRDIQLMNSFIPLIIDRDVFSKQIEIFAIKFSK